MASATGAQGSTRAAASGSGRYVSKLRVENTVDLAGSAKAWSSVAVGGAPLGTGDAYDLAASAIVLPEGLPIDSTNPHEMASVDFSVLPGAGVGTTLESMVTLELDVEDIVLGTDLSLVFSGGEAEGEGFEALMLTILRVDTVVFNESFDALSEVTDFFDGRSLALGGDFDALPVVFGAEDPIPLKIKLSWQSAASGWSFRGKLRVLASIPEPSSAPLLALGLLMIALRARRHR